MKCITANQFQTSERYYKLPKVLFEDYAKKYCHENFTIEKNKADRKRKVVSLSGITR